MIARSAPMPLKLRHLFVRVAPSVCMKFEVLVYTYTCGRPWWSRIVASSATRVGGRMLSVGLLNVDVIWFEALPSLKILCPILRDQ